MNWNPTEKARDMLNGMMKVTEARVKGAHDSQMVITGGRAYIVYEANDVRAGESGAWPFVYCAMSIVNIAAGCVERVVEIARPSQEFGNACLRPGACFVPRILIRDAETLRIFFTSMDPGVREQETWYRDYSLAAGAFEDAIHPMMLETCLGSFPMEPRHFHAQAKAQGFSGPVSDNGFYMFDIDKSFGGVRYVALNNFDTKQNALGMFSKSLDSVRVIGNYNEPFSAALSESAIGIMPDGRWVAIIRSDAGSCNYRFATSSDGAEWTCGEEWPVVTGGSNSKPLLESIGGVYLLGWQAQPARSRFNIDISPDFISWRRIFAFDNEEFSLQYPSLYVYEGEVYICGTHGTVSGGIDRRDSIWFGHLISVSDISALAGDI